MTTGPLGMGIPNAVGLAVAEALPSLFDAFTAEESSVRTAPGTLCQAHLAAVYNKSGPQGQSPSTMKS